MCPAGGKVPGLLHRPLAGGVCGDAGDVQAPVPVFEERQRVQPGSDGSVEMEEVDGDDVLSLVGEKLPPGRAGTARGRADARSVQDLSDRGRGDRVPESGQLALDPPVPHRAFSRAGFRVSFLSAALVGGGPVRVRRAL